MSLDRDALDRWITGGRYSSEPLRVTCSACGEASSVLAESEYGATYWTPEDCPRCGAAWTEDAAWELDGPDEDAAYDRYREERDA